MADRERRARRARRVSGGVPTTAVRPARAEDVPRLVALMAEFYAEAGFDLPAGPAARTFERLAAEPALGAVWLLEADGEPAGYVAMTVAFSMEYGGPRAFVDDLFVRAPYRGRGLAAAALAEVRRACEARGVRALYVEVGPEHDAARRVYLRAGFADTGRLLLGQEIAAPLHVT